MDKKCLVRETVLFENQLHCCELRKVDGGGGDDDDDDDDDNNNNNNNIFKCCGK
jgi:hypothetical protein